MRQPLPESATCAKCMLHLAPFQEHVKEGGKLYHPSCHLRVLKDRLDARRQEARKTA